MEAWWLKMEPWRFYRLVAVDSQSHHFEEELDPYKREKLDSERDESGADPQP
jgi:hypothetical protein